MVDFIEKPIPVFVLLEKIIDMIEKRGHSHSAAG